MLVDGKVVKKKKNKFGTPSYVVNTDKEKIEVAFYKYLEINGRLWFLMNIIYFFISLFGILDVGYDKNCVVIDSKFTIDVKDKSKTVFIVEKLVDSGKVMTVQSDTNVNEEKNIYYVDNKAKKKRKIAIATRIVLLVALVVTAVILL